MYLLAALVTMWLPSKPYAQVIKTYNAEYQLRARFPENTKVCVAQSGGHPHGFYAWHGGSETQCHLSERLAPTAFGIWADYNSSFETALVTQLWEGCQTSSSSVLNAAQLSEIKFTKHESLACVLENADGSLSIQVVAMAGPLDPDFKAPRYIYSASLVSSRNRLFSDLKMFKSFLASIELATGNN